jgi:hypothetical protein
MDQLHGRLQMQRPQFLDRQSRLVILTGAKRSWGSAVPVADILARMSVALKTSTASRRIANSLIAILAGAVLALVTTGAMAHAQKDKAAGVNTTTAPKFSVALRANDSDLEVGKPIPVAIKVTNVTDFDASFETYSFYPEYSYFRWSLKLDDQPVEKTAFHRVLLNEQLPSDPPQIASGRSMWVKVHSGESIELAADVGKLYKIDRPGNYSLQVMLSGHNQSSPSNVLELMVK